MNSRRRIEDQIEVRVANAYLRPITDMVAAKIGHSHCRGTILDAIVEASSREPKK